MSSLIRIGVIGDFESERPSHKATNEALNHCADYLNINLDVKWLSTASLEKDIDKIVCDFDGLWCAPGIYKSMNGALKAIQFARENDYPYIGTCGGFQCTVIEYTRNKLGLKDVQHAEYSQNAQNLIITPLSCSLVGQRRKVFIDKGSEVYKFYKSTEVIEQFNCNYGINPKYRKIIDESGFKTVGTDEKGEVRILELPQNKFYIATLFQPQLSSSPAKPHKLITAYLNHAKEFKLERDRNNHF